MISNKLQQKMKGKFKNKILTFTLKKYLTEKKEGKRILFNKTWYNYLRTAKQLQTIPMR